MTTFAHISQDHLRNFCETRKPNRLVANVAHGADCIPYQRPAQHIFEFRKGYGRKAQLMHLRVGKDLNFVPESLNVV